MLINLIAFFLASSETMGGDTRIMIELAKQTLLQRKDVKLRVFTSPEGELLFKENGLVGENVTYETLPSSAKSSLSFWGHLKLLKMSVNFLKNYSFKKGELIYTRSHFWPELFASYYLKKKYSVKWLATMFLFYPLPWKGFAYSYDTKIIMPSVSNIWKYIYSNVSFWFIKRSADLVLITNSSDEGYFKRTRVPLKQVLPVYGGLDLKEVATAPNSKVKKYNGIFVGRIHQQKGIESLIRSWSNVIGKMPKAKLGIIGVGDEAYVKQMKRLAKGLKVDKSIDWLGYINGVEKYKILKKSKVFLHSTVYDNNGMAAAEALASGVPVVRFDLPPLADVYQKGCLVAKRNDVTDFAQKVLMILDDEKLYNRLHKEALDTAKLWDWKYKGRKFLNFLSQN